MLSVGYFNHVYDSLTEYGRQCFVILYYILCGSIMTGRVAKEPGPFNAPRKESQSSSLKTGI